MRPAAAKEPQFFNEELIKSPRSMAQEFRYEKTVQLRQQLYEARTGVGGSGSGGGGGELKTSLSLQSRQEEHENQINIAEQEGKDEEEAEAEEDHKDNADDVNRIIIVHFNTEFSQHLNKPFVVNSVPAIGDLIIASKPEKNDLIQETELFYLLKKLCITSEKMISDRVYSRITPNRAGLVDFVSFANFLCLDITWIDWSKLTLPEIVLRIGMEIYRSLTADTRELSLKHIMEYCKEHRDIDIDLIQIMEMLNFYSNAQTGGIKKRQNIVQFFVCVSPRLTASLSVSAFLATLTTIIQTRWPVAIHQRRRMRQLGQLSEFSSRRNKSSKFNNDWTNNNNSNNLIIENEINEYLLQNKPTSKGWLYRLSKKKANKWSNLFFFTSCDSNNILFSVKPTGLKRDISIEDVDLYRCSFIEQSKGAEIVSESNELEKRHFFIVDNKAQKAYLIKSEESAQIISVISLLNSKRHQVPSLAENDVFRLVQRVDFEFTAVIEIAVCKKICVDLIHVNLKNYTLKKQFLTISQGRLRIFNLKVKDQVDLSQYKVIYDSNVSCPLTQTSFSFALEKESADSASTQRNLQTVLMTEQFEESSVVAFNTQQNDQDQDNQVRAVASQSTPTASASSTSKPGFFSSFMKKISRKKPERLILAADSNIKRQQWIFTINFYKSILLKIAQGVRFNTEPVAAYRQAQEKDIFEVNDQDDYYNVFSTQDKRKEDEEHRNKTTRPQLQSQLQQSQQPPLHQRKKEIFTSEQNDRKTNRLDSEEAMITLTFPNFVAGNNFFLQQCELKHEGRIVIPSKEIRSLDERSIWEKFLTYFFSVNTDNTTAPEEETSRKFNPSNSAVAKSKPITVAELMSQQSTNEIDYCLTEFDQEPHARSAFSAQHKYIVSIGKPDSNEDTLEGKGSNNSIQRMLGIERGVLPISQYQQQLFHHHHQNNHEHHQSKYQQQQLEIKKQTSSSTDCGVTVTPGCTKKVNQ